MHAALQDVDSVVHVLELMTDDSANCTLSSLTLGW